MMKQTSLTAKLSPLVFFAGLLFVTNLHLIQGEPPSTLIFRQDLVLAGQWWRLITHPLVHVSWYHLFLDSSAMIILWHELRLETLGQKIAALVPCLLMSLTWTILFSPLVAVTGYCGLSGIAHGLMLLLGLQWLAAGLKNRQPSKTSLKMAVAGGILILAITAKSVAEVAHGEASLVQYHLADLGVPIVHAHLGGVIGGAVAFLSLCLPGAFDSKP